MNTFADRRFRYRTLQHIDTTAGGRFRYRTLQHMYTTANERHYYRTLQNSTTSPTNIDFWSVSLFYEVFVFNLSRSVKLKGHLMNEVFSFTFS